MRRILENLPPDARLHTVGIGAAVNSTLTGWAARAGRGVEVLVGEQKSAGAAAQRLLQAMAGPVLTDLVIEGSVLQATAPRRPKDVFESQPALAALELKPEGSGLEVRGRLADGDPWIQKLEIAPQAAKIETDMATPPSPIGLQNPAYSSYPPPAQSLGAFAGKAISGAWTLKVRDLAHIDVGTLNSWEIDFRAP
jgi:hypothetical protein